MVRLRGGRTLLVAVPAAAALALFVGAALALFTDPASVPGNAFTSDTLDPASGLSATGGTSVDLSWTATADTYASGHRVLRGTASGGPYSQIAEVTPRTTTTYTDTPADGTYYYVVRAFYQSWESINSNEASATVSAPPAGISFDDAPSSNSALNVSTLSWSHTIGGGSNRKLIVGVAVEEDVLGDEPVTGITYNGVPLTFAQAVTAGPGFLTRAEVWYMDEANLPASGTYTIQVSTTGAVRELIAGAITIAGAQSGAPEATATNTNFDNATITTAITTLTNGAWLIDVASSGDAGSFTSGAGQTKRWEASASSATGASSTIEVATAGASSMAQTHSAISRRNAHVVIAVAPAP